MYLTFVIAMVEVSRWDGDIVIQESKNTYCCPFTEFVDPGLT